MNLSYNLQSDGIINIEVNVFDYSVKTAYLHARCKYVRQSTAKPIVRGSKLGKGSFQLLFSYPSAIANGQKGYTYVVQNYETGIGRRGKLSHIRPSVCPFELTDLI